MHGEGDTAGWQPDWLGMAQVCMTPDRWAIRSHEVTSTRGWVTWWLPDQ